MDCGSLIPLWIRSAYAVGIRILQTRAFTPKGPTNSKWIVEGGRTSQRYPGVSKAVSSHSTPKCDMDCGSLIPLWIRSAYAVGIRISPTRAHTLMDPQIANGSWRAVGHHSVTLTYPKLCRATALQISYSAGVASVVVGAGCSP